MLGSPVTASWQTDDMTGIEDKINAAAGLETHELRVAWRHHYQSEPPARLSRDLLIRAIAYKIQERTFGGLTKATKRKLQMLARKLETKGGNAFEPDLTLKPGSRLVREWRGVPHSVIVLEDGFDYGGQRYRSLTKIAREITGAHWSGPRFFGLTQTKSSATANAAAAEQ